MFKSRFNEMFGDIGNNEKGWPICKLSEIAEIKIGPFGSLLHKEDYVENGHPVVNPANINDGKVVVDPKLTISESKYYELKAYQLNVGDIVLGRRGEMGRCAIITETGMLCGTGSIIIRPNYKMNAYFLKYILSSPVYKSIIESKAVGVTMLNLNVPIVSSFNIPLLPGSSQDEYISILKKVDKSKFMLASTCIVICSGVKRPVYV